MVIMHVWRIAINWLSGKIAGKIWSDLCLPSFFLLCRNAGPDSVAVEVFIVGRWLTHGDFALEAEVDFQAVVEHRLIFA